MACWRKKMEFDRMLIGIPPLLGPDLLHALRAMGHGDEIALVDANYPAAAQARRLIRADGLALIDVLEAVLRVLPLDRDGAGAIFRAALNNDPAEAGPIHRRIDALCAERAPGFAVIPLAGSHLYPRIGAAFALVATGEMQTFANVILRKGVIAAAGA
ncbi:MAG: RbsD/FucU family protein [Gemmobacter sp.]